MIVILSDGVILSEATDPRPRSERPTAPAEILRFAQDDKKGGAR